jgi:hypothetical protein
MLLLQYNCIEHLAPVLLLGLHCMNPHVARQSLYDKTLCLKVHELVIWRAVEDWYNIW